MAVGRRVPAAVVLLLGTARAEADEVACRKLGFAPSLLCSSCDRLGDHVGLDDPLTSECRGCCVEEVNGTGGSYAQATLDICK